MIFDYVLSNACNFMQLKMTEIYDKYDMMICLILLAAPFGMITFKVEMI